MCGIVAGVAERNITPILLEGLRRLEYRGYDSAGVAIMTGSGQLERRRACGKVEALTQLLEEQPLSGQLGIAHTRWATHGRPSEANAHPHMSGTRVALVHNGIIENHNALKAQLQKAGYAFDSETDTEVVAHALEQALQTAEQPEQALQSTLSLLEGAYALVVMLDDAPNTLWVARHGAPLVIGMGIGEHFVASDTLALLPVTQRFIYLQEGDIAAITPDGVTLWNDGERVERAIQTVKWTAETAGRGEYRHYMQKEIHEQPLAIGEALEGRMGDHQIPDSVFGFEAGEIFDRVERVQLLACGTSYHAAMVARYWLESVGVPAQVDIASEYRYRDPLVTPNTLLVTISQSGETADTLAALRDKKDRHLASLTICNVPESALVRESDLTFLTHAGPEIGVASTKAFTTQLVGLLMLVSTLGRRFGLSAEAADHIMQALRHLPEAVEAALEMDDDIRALAQDLVGYEHCLYLGRDTLYPIALEGALKLKEISYIHAEAYPAGELKHGPLALVDEKMPVIAVAGPGMLSSKLKSNLAEVLARGGQVTVFQDEGVGQDEADRLRVLATPAVSPWIAPMVLTIPLQLLSYHVAVMKGTDVDQPRNLAKSVTVE